jgi:hypothetical protein
MSATHPTEAEMAKRRELGAAMNARARAGSKLVEARERWKRLSSMARPGSAVAVALEAAEAEYEAAAAAERALERECGLGAWRERRFTTEGGGDGRSGEGATGTDPDSVVPRHGGC